MRAYVIERSTCLTEQEKVSGRSCGQQSKVQGEAAQIRLVQAPGRILSLVPFRDRSDVIGLLYRFTKMTCSKRRDKGKGSREAIFGPGLGRVTVCWGLRGAHYGALFTGPLARDPIKPMEAEQLPGAADHASY